jgi:predicted nucleic acid-binding protein
LNRATLDASVLVSASSPKDLFFRPSRAVLRQLSSAGVRIIEPASARVEVACALARILRNQIRGVELASTLFLSLNLTEVSWDSALLDLAIRRGTEHFLRRADALYVATAELYDTQLISWDQEHVDRCGALSPEQWLSQKA